MTAPIDLECPKCKAGAGRSCIMQGGVGDGMTLDYHHAGRVDAAARASDEAQHGGRPPNWTKP